MGEEEYSCKGMPEGATCMSAREGVCGHRWRCLQDGAAPGAGQGHCEERQGQGEGGQGERAGNPRAGRRRRRQHAAADACAQPLPIRSQAVVMRIAVDPWEDDNGDLYVPGFVYTEIEPRRWEIGTRNPQVIPSLRPLTVQK
nr:TraV family lipoprotein [Azotobacter chroococcum]